MMKLLRQNALTLYQNDKLVSFREIWDQFVENRKKPFKELTVDKQLVIKDARLYVKRLKPLFETEGSVTTSNYFTSVLTAKFSLQKSITGNDRNFEGKTARYSSSYGNCDRKRSIVVKVYFFDGLAVVRYEPKTKKNDLYSVISVS